AGEAAVFGRRHEAGGQHAQQFVMGVGLPVAALEDLHQLGALDQRTGVNLQFVGAEVGIAEHTPVILDVFVGRAAVQVGHPMGVDFESGTPQQSDRAAGGGDIVSAPVHAQDVIVQALEAD